MFKASPEAEISANLRDPDIDIPKSLAETLNNLSRSRSPQYKSMRQSNDTTTIQHLLCAKTEFLPMVFLYSPLPFWEDGTIFGFSMDIQIGEHGKSYLFSVFPKEGIK